MNFFEKRKQKYKIIFKISFRIIRIKMKSYINSLKVFSIKIKHRRKAFTSV